MRACVCACVRACVHACVQRACVCATCVCMYVVVCTVQYVGILTISGVISELNLIYNTVV